jgi:hypothetical protein
MEQTKCTSTIKYNHPLLTEAAKRGFKLGAVYKALRTRAKWIIEYRGPNYYDSEYGEIVIGGFVIARQMDMKLDNIPENFAWAELILCVIPEGQIVEEEHNVLSASFNSFMVSKPTAWLEATWLMAIRRYMWENNGKMHEHDCPPTYREWEKKVVENVVGT